MKPLFRLVLVLLTTGLAAPSMAAQTVAEYTGSSSRTLPEFEVRAPWILDWRVTTDSEREAAVDVSLERGGIGVHEGSVLKTRWPGNGVRLFEESGRFYFRVNSSLAKWHLKVVELTPEEAKAYTPRVIGEPR